MNPTPEPRTASLLDGPVQFLKGVGPRRAELLGRLGVRTARDLLLHVPRRYEDASTVTPIGHVRVGDDVTLIGEVRSKGVLPTRSGLRIFQAILRDGTGQIEASWPGQPFLDRSIRTGDLLLVTGPVRFFQTRQIQPREHIVLGPADEADASGIVLPIYPATEGLSQKVLRSILDQNLDRLLEAAAGDELLETRELRSLDLPPLAQALAWLHRPASLAEAERGRRRLAWDEALVTQLLHARAHQRARRERVGIRFQRSDALIAPLYRSLPFALTGAQTRAIAEIYADMTSPERMNRMLQGDVGSGKTIVALFAMALAAESGHQSALMAPTEILAEQHARNLRVQAEGLELRIELLTGRLGAGERRRVREAAASGDATIVVGTHALIQEGVVFSNLGLAVIDEQHRFGVRQRLALAARGEAPDVLVMSATPIPRSLALTLFGDLDLTVLDERPPGRQPVRTLLRREQDRDRVCEFVREQVGAGRQAYFVYPLVEESEKMDLRAATEEYERLAGAVFPDLRVGLLHGQMPGEEKDRTMTAFVRGDVDILVATTVIEVGIDVPNASVMVIEHAERFGLSQLHQLRGRVGRGADASWCVLVASDGPGVAERLRVVGETEDGFYIARADLRLRGMGDFFGARQHGLPEFRFFDAERDEDLLVRARERARSIIASDPELDSARNAPVRRALETRFGDRERLYDVG